jgi:hypothetical protein
MKKLFKGDGLLAPNGSQVVLPEGFVPGLLGALDHTPQQPRPWWHLSNGVYPPDSPHEATGAIRIQPVPLETLSKDLLVAPSTIFSPCGHPFLNHFGILGASFRQEVAPQTFLQER